MKIRWSRRAQAQFHEAIVYLEEQRPGSGRSFHAEVGAVVELIQWHPRAFPRVPGVPRGDVRRALVRHYHHWVIFELSGNAEEALLLAVWHTRRRPLGWTRGR